MTYYISAKRFYFENKIKEGGYLAIVMVVSAIGRKMTRRCRGAGLQ